MSATPARELFIYYRLASVHASAAKALVEEFQARLRQCHPGLETRLLCRVEARDPALQTWMETYRLTSPVTPQGVDEALAADIERAAAQDLAPLIDGARHLEAFSACA